jgi:hypothetical protein
LPIENSASRSCWENTSTATLGWVRRMPVSAPKRCVPTSATSCGVRTRTIAT